VSERIDVHFHTIPEFFRAATEGAGRRPAISSGLPQWSPERALEVMDRNGIATTILSISQPGVHFGDDAKARELARRCNDYVRELIDRFPRRFGAFGVVPLPDVDGACAEAVRCLDELGLDGIVLFASCGERFLGDPAFDALLDVLDERAAVVFIHPALHPAVSRLQLDLPAFVLEYPFDTTRAATNLIFRGSLDRFPRIRFILAHAGGTLPYLAFRLAWSSTIDPGRLGSLGPPYVLERLRRFWYDTALASSRHVLAALHAVADPSRILFGSDWPYAPETVTRASIMPFDGESESECASRHEQYRRNALELFPRLR